MVGLILGFGFAGVLVRGIKPPNIAIERPLKARKDIHGRQLQLHPTVGDFAFADVGGNVGIGGDGGGEVRTMCRLIKISCLPTINQYAWSNDAANL
jgi:hypothetical protein